MKPLRKLFTTLTPPLVLVALMISLIGGAVIVTPARAASITVTTTSDEYGAGAGCSLREAIRAANTNAAFGGCPAGAAGSDTINLGAGTYQLTIANAGGTNEDGNATGDLDILESLIIQGAGSGATFIQAGTNNSNGIDKVLAINPVCTSVVNATIDGVTIRYGYNSQLITAPDYSFSGGGIDYCAGGGGGTLALSNSIVSDNTNLNAYGGGLNTDAYLTASYAVNITNVTFQNNRTLTAVNTGTGGAINIFGDQVTAVITGSTFTGNTTANPTSAGGAIYFRPSAVTVGPTSSLSISGSTFSSNTAAGSGGAIGTGTYGAGTTVTISNSSFTGNAATNSFGGALYLDSTNLNTTPFSLTHLIITGNTAGLEGGGLFIGNSNVTMSKSFIVGNNAPTAKGLRKSVDAATAMVENNWWGCSTTPSAAPCDTVSTAGGTLDFTPWYRNQLTATTSPIVTNQSTSLTASFLTNSAGSPVPLADISEIIGKSVAWAATNGNLSGTQGTVQAAGTATGSFQATAAGTAILSAKVSNDNTSPISSNVLSLTVNKASTTAAITNGATVSSVDSVTGEPVTVTFSVTGAFGNSPTAPTGNVTVSDGTDSCIGTVAAGQCNITFKTAGSKTITATYNGDSNFLASPASTSVSHTVNKADTTTTITSDTPDPSVTGETVTFNVTVAAVAPGAVVAPTTITGSVTVSDGGSNSCIAALTAGAGSCTIDFPAAGPYSMTGAYGGDLNFNGSTSSADSHTVNKADTTTTITSDTPDPSSGVQSVTVNFTVDVTSPGAGTPTGNVTVSDGVDSCIGTVADGFCSLTLTTNGARTLTASYAGDVNFNNSASVGTPHTVDAIPPDVTINQAVGQVDPTNTGPIHFTVVFSEPVTDFDDAPDVTLSGTAGATTALITEIAPNDGTTYDVAVSGMTGDGTVIADVAAGAAQDGVGNLSNASTSTDKTVTYDITQPTVTIDQAAGQSDPTGTSPIDFTVVFSEPVTDFDDVSDVTLSGSAGATTALITEIAPNDGTTYNVAVSGMTGDGTVIAEIPAGAATDAAANLSVASTSSYITLTYD